MELTITGLGADGDGMVRTPAGGTLYVPFTLPGEQVLAHPDGKRAVVERIVAPSPDRIAPICGHFGACGGCALQHWRPDAYAAWKAGLLAAALRRAGYAEPVIAPLARSPPGSRRRLDFAARRAGGRLVLGLHRAGAAEVIDIAACPVLHPALNALLEPLRAVLTGLAGLRREAAIVANLLDTGPDILLRTDAALSTPDRSALADFARAHAVPRLSWARGTGVPEPVALLGPARISLGGVAVTPPPGAFLQATAAGEAAIVAATLAGLPDKLSPRARIAELYAGCGTLSFALAARAGVDAYEGDGPAVAALTQASRAGGLEGRVKSIRQDLTRRPVLTREFSSHAAVVLDPPYAGAGPQLREIAASTLRRVIYVSCNPAALAREAAALREAGFVLSAATPIDQFLYTARLESVVVFSRP